MLVCGGCKIVSFGVISDSLAVSAFMTPVTADVVSMYGTSHACSISDQ